ncbi:hypothetical protein ABH924_003958 [Arthrobacter sp. GAS37]
MIEDSAGVSGESTVNVVLGACPTAGQATCWLPKPVANLASGRNGSKDSLTRCEVEAYLSLAPGHRITVLDHETGEVWRGWVDVPFPQHGFVWVFTDLGERKLLDIGLHTVWRSDARQGAAAVLTPNGTSSQ